MAVEREDQPVLASSPVSRRSPSLPRPQAPGRRGLSFRSTTRIFFVFGRNHKSNRHSELDMKNGHSDFPERHMTFNLDSAEEREDALFHACVMAVGEGLPHLAVGEIIDPPHDMFDAALARQIALHIMIRQFHVPKRRVVEMQGRSREAVNRALRIIDARCERPVFLAHYAFMAGRASAVLLSMFEEAA